MRLTTLIVDDEPLAREGVELMLRDEPDVEVIATCTDGAEAVRAILRLHPDVVFLDVKMPGMSGFDVIDAVGSDRMPVVVFLTAFEQYALRAFRVHAVDYLLKPLDAAKLAEALARARTELAHRDVAARAAQLAALLEDLGAHTQGRDDDGEHIVVRTAGRLHVLRPQELAWIEAEGDYVTIHAGSKAHLVRDSLRNMEERLASHGFVRIHRSSLVNVDKIRELEATAKGDYDVILDGGVRLRVGRNYKDALFARLEPRG
jgi:two-component system, LytTR family, response regulator